VQTVNSMCQLGTQPSNGPVVQTGLKSFFVSIIFS